MTAPVVLALVGLALAFVGSLILAFSLNSLLTTFSFAIDAHDLTIETLVHPTANVPVFTGIDTHLRKGEKSARFRTVLGVLMLGIGSSLQALAVFAAVA